MILGGLQKSNIQRKIKKELLRGNSEVTDANQKVNSILILVDADSQENLDQTISKKLHIEIEKVTTLFLVAKQESDSNYKNELTEEDFYLLGNLKNESVEKIIQTEFDLLLNYTNDNLYLNYITAFSKAKFKVGLFNKQQLFDLVIAIDKDDVNSFHNELEKYLKILNKI